MAPYVNSWNMMSIATMAAASANTRTNIIAVNILGAADGFLPSAVILALEHWANTQHGPAMQSVNISKSARFLSIISPR